MLMLPLWLTPLAVVPTFIDDRKATLSSVVEGVAAKIPGECNIGVNPAFLLMVLQIERPSLRLAESGSLLLAGLRFRNL